MDEIFVIANGNVKLIFQPAEEGAPEGEEGGAELMLKQGLFEAEKPDAIFGMHVANFKNGQICYNGEWRNGKEEGEGTFYENGSIYKGQ